MNILNDENLILVTCGSLLGKLHRDKFVCPGIHRDCIEYEGQFISPKVFSVMGDKEKLKDWKNAIRINGIQLRKYIESGQLDFTNHQEMCTGRCIPRAPLKTMMFEDGTISPIFVPMVTNIATIKEHTYCHLPDQNENVSEHGYNNSIPDMEEELDIKPNVEELQKIVAINTVPVESIDEPPDDSQTFWKGIIDLGLADEIFREIKSNLDTLKNDMIKGHCPPNEAKRLSRVVSELGLTTKLKYRLAAHRTDTERQKEKLDREMEELRRRVAEAQHKKELLKRKSECFEQLIDFRKPKRLMNQPLSLSPIPMTTVMSIPGLASGTVSSLSQLIPPTMTSALSQNSNSVMPPHTAAISVTSTTTTVTSSVQSNHIKLNQLSEMP